MLLYTRINLNIWLWLWWWLMMIDDILSGFQNVAVFWTSYSFFWVISRCLNCICRRFGTACTNFIGGANRKNNGKTCSNILAASSRLFFLLTPTMKMEQTKRSETSAYKIQPPRNHPKERIKHDIPYVYWIVYHLDSWIKRDQLEALVPQPAYRYHTTPAKPQRNTNTHRTRAIQPMK